MCTTDKKDRKIGEIGAIDFSINRYSTTAFMHGCILHMSATVTITCRYHAYMPSVVTPSLLLVPQSGIHCLTICAIQLLDQDQFRRSLKTHLSACC